MKFDMTFLNICIELREKISVITSALKTVEFDASGHCNCCGVKNEHKDECIVGKALKR